MVAKRVLLIGLDPAVVDYDRCPGLTAEKLEAGLRQHFPKGMDLSNVHQNRLNAVARQLKERPRETLQFFSPAQKFNECIASTG